MSGATSIVQSRLLRHTLFVMRRILPLVAWLISSAPLGAAVVDSAANGFTVKVTVTIQAAPDEVYQKLVRNVGEWWNPEHTFSRDAHNLSIDDKPLGCWCEKLGNNGGVRHMQVITAAPGKALVFAGGMGPLQSLAVTGSM